MRIVIVFLLVFAAAGCSQPPAAEANIEKALAALEKAVERNNPDPVLARLHSDFQLNRGGETLSRHRAEKLLRLALRRHHNVSVVLTRVKVESDAARANRAKAWFSAVVTSSSRSRFLPEDGALYRIESDWAVEDGHWKLRQLESKRTLNPR